MSASAAARCNFGGPTRAVRSQSLPLRPWPHTAHGPACGARVLGARSRSVSAAASGGGGAQTTMNVKSVSTYDCGMETCAPLIAHIAHQMTKK
eukprot:4939992-Prymnesium_polylepis.2